jgi:hypothetical protein
MTGLRALLLAGVVALLAACGAGAGNADLSEASVRTFVRGVEAATQDMDVDALEDALADDFVYTSDGQASTGSPRTLDKPAMVSGLRKMYDDVAQHEYRSTINGVLVAKDAQSARVALSQTTGFISGGHAVHSSSDQVYTVALREGALKIVAIESRTTGLTVDGKTLR